MRSANHIESRVKASPIHVGDFIYCRSKYYRDQLQLPEELGLVIEIKRSNFKILYTNDKRCWLPREAVADIFLRSRSLRPIVVSMRPLAFSNFPTQTAR